MTNKANLINKLHHPKSFSSPYAIFQAPSSDYRWLFMGRRKSLQSIECLLYPLKQIRDAFNKEIEIKAWFDGHGAAPGHLWPWVSGMLPLLLFIPMHNTAFPLQSRALAARAAETERIQFLCGTQTLRNENQVGREWAWHWEVVSPSLITWIFQLVW